VNIGDICSMSATARASNIHGKKISPTEVAEWMPNAVPIVFVVDNDATVRESLQLLIRNAGCHVETFASAEEFLSRPRVVTPSCLVLDVTLPDLNGLDLQKRIADRVDMPIIFFTGDHDVRTTVRAMKAGAAEFLTKPCDRDVLLSAIRNAVDRSNRVLREEAQMRSLRNHFASLTPREREVMDLVVAGELNKQIGAELGISEITVKAHRGKVMRKMKAGSLAGLVTMAERLYPAICANAWETTNQLFPQDAPEEQVRVN
jgi:FixJ family two-component response regulator